MVVSWLVAVLVLVGLPAMLGLIDAESVSERPIVADVSVFLLTVLPVLLYLITAEAGAAHATWGKRRALLRVESMNSDPPGLGTVVVRNLVKLSPWQTGHMAAMRFAGENQEAFALTCLAASAGLTVAVVGPVLIGRRGVHDVLAETRVIPTHQRAAPFRLDLDETGGTRPHPS